MKKKSFIESWIVPSENKKPEEQNSAHGFSEGSEVSKEQDAAHSSLSVCPFCGLLPEWVNESLQDGHFYIRCPHCHIVMKEDRRDKVIGMWNRRAELTRLRSGLQQKDELHDDLRDRCALQMEQDARRIAQLIQLFIDVTGVHPDDFKSKAK